MQSWLGGGVLLLVAAALWLVYLVPNWLRRSEYLATERNAVRLQQTIRVLAETAETPDAIRIESVAKARKAVAETLAARPVAVGTAARLPLPAAVDPRVRAAARLRRTRLATTLVLVAALAVLGWQAWTMLQGGGLAAGSTMVVAIAGLAAIGAGTLQGRLGKVKAERDAQLAKLRVETPTRRTATPVQDFALSSAPAERSERAPWTPQSLPQPLAAVRREAALAAARAEALRNAAAGSAETGRSLAVARALAAQEASGPVPARTHANAAARSVDPSPAAVDQRRESVLAGAATPAEPPTLRLPSRYAAMGLVDVPAGSGLDLDGALARRRAS